MIRTCFWLILTMMPWVMYAQLTDRLEVNRNEITITREDGFDRIRLGDAYMQEIGMPELPVVKKSFVIPTDAVVTGLKITESGRSPIAGNYQVYPVQPPSKTGEDIEPVFVRSDSVYRSAADFPGKTAVISFDGMIQGYHVVTVCYYPLVYVPAKSELYLRNIEVAINYQENTSVEPEAPISRYRGNLAKQYVRSMVENPSDVERYSGSFRVIPERTSLNPEVHDSRQRSVYSFDEIVPDYIIITSNRLRESFQKLADWKTKKGIPTIVESVQNINEEYPGGDLQEKIHNYLLHVRKRWNAAGMYILFGGDVNEVPARTYKINGTQVSDGYYVSDSVECTFKGYTLLLYKSGETPFNSGRIPVKNTVEADNFIRKIISYEKASEAEVDYNYFNNSLIVNAFMDKKIKPYNGFMKKIYDYCQGKPANFWYMFDHFNCTKDDHDLKDSYHAERGVELNRNNLLSGLKNDKTVINQFFHFIYHMDHSVTTALGSSSADKGESVSINDVEGAVFKPKYYQVIMSGSCHPADFGKDCIAEHLLNKVDAGAVAIIGNTDVGYYGEEDQLERLYQHLYSSQESTYGQFSLGYLRLKAADGGSQRMRLHLLGDPEMPLWTRKPTDLNVAVSPATLQNGLHDISVKVSGIPSGQQAMICLKKDNEGYATRIVDRDGTYLFTFTPVTPGKIDVTVTSHNCRPFETQLTVSGGMPSLRISGITFNDDSTNGGKGNGNRMLDAGETVKMKITLQNTSPYTLNVPSGRLFCSSKYLSLPDGMVEFGTIAPGQSLISTNEVEFTISNDIGGIQLLKNDLNAIRFSLHMSDQFGTAYVDTFKVNVYAPELAVGYQRLSQRLTSGGNGTLHIGLMNVGKSSTGRLTATLTLDSIGSCVSSILLASRTYGSIDSKETAENSQPFFFKTNNLYSDTNKSLKMNLTVTNEYGRSWKFSVDPGDVGKQLPGQYISFIPGDKNIAVYWISHSERYNLYRSDEIDGDYVKMNEYPLVSGYYNDDKIRPNKFYYYKLAAISPFGNEGPLSDPQRASASLSLMKGFPKFLPESRDIQGSVCVADVDNDGKKELFYTQRNFNTGREGYLMGFRHTGEELYDIDNNPATVSGFARLSATVWATPVIGDLKGDGEQKIITVTRNEEAGTTLNSVTCFTAGDYDGDNLPDEVWRRQPETQFYRGAVVSNLDYSLDGSMEVVLRGDDAIRIADADGNVKYRFGSGGYSMPAVADLDGDDDKEIITANYKEINVWHHNGIPFTQKPFFTLTQPRDTCGSSPVVCDLDRDGNKEILFMVKSRDEKQNIISTVWVLKPDGTRLPGWDGTQKVNFYSVLLPGELSVGDLDQDGYPEVVVIGTHMLKVWKKDGTLLFSKILDLVDPVRITAVIADVDGDYYPELVVGVGEYIYAFDSQGNDVRGFPLVTDYPFVSSVYVGDIDNDRQNEVVAVDGGNIYAWKTRGNPQAIEWGSERHDQWNTGEYAPVCEPMLILSDKTFNGGSPCGNLIIQSGTFTVPSGKKLVIQRPGKIIVRPGATLEVDGGTILNANILALPGSRVTVKNGGTINLWLDTKLDIRQGAVLDWQEGAVTID